MSTRSSSRLKRKAQDEIKPDNTLTPAPSQSARKRKTNKEEIKLQKFAETALTKEIPSKRKRNANDEIEKEPTPTPTVLDSTDLPTPDARQYFLVKAEPETRMEKGVDVKFSLDDLKVYKIQP
jgi:hypothetical protein